MKKIKISREILWIKSRKKPKRFKRLRRMHAGFRLISKEKKIDFKNSTKLTRTLNRNKNKTKIFWENYQNNSPNSFRKKVLCKLKSTFCKMMWNRWNSKWKSSKRLKRNFNKITNRLKRLWMKIITNSWLSRRANFRKKQRRWWKRYLRKNYSFHWWRNKYRIGK